MKNKTLPKLYNFFSYKLLVISLSVSVVFAGVLPLSSKTKRYTARAYDPKTKAYLFTARYKEYWKRGRHISTVISYRKAKTKGLFSVKKLNFKKSLIAPDMTYEEPETGYFNRSKKKAKKSFELYLQEGSNEQMTKKVVPFKSTGVIDEGLHHFIKKNWSQLMQNKKIGFQYVVPAKQRSHNFFVRKEEESERTVTFTIIVSSLLVRLFANPIRVTYHKRSKRILIYEGVTNLREKKKIMFAKMIFSY